MPQKRVAAKAQKPDRARHIALSSYVDGLYVEVDKVAKKSPRDELSDLAVQRVNRAIRDAKSILDGFDEYVSDLAEFVPAGDNPEARDAVLVLSEIKAALSRTYAKYQLAWQ
jgi:hypothetical protein